MTKLSGNKILIISGPTCSGKSELATRIAKKANGVIINADSVQLYQDLPIISAQPTKKELLETPHLLYSTLTYNEDCSVAIWLELTVKAINQTKANNQLPIIVGGTGMYISKLINGISSIPEISDAIRDFSRNFYEQVGKEKFIKALIDQGERPDKISNLDKQRLIRRMEVLKQTGQTIDWWHENQLNKKFYDQNQFLHFNIEPEREKLYQACNQRFLKMLEMGAIEEVENFLKKQPDDNLPITKTIGYREIKALLENKINLQTTINLATQKTRNYAKAQLTWFRNQFKEKITISHIDEINNF